MTRHEAKEKVTEMWGEMGLVARAGAVLGLLASLWLLTTAAKGTVQLWLVPQSQLRARDDSLNAFFTRQQIADIQWKAADAEFKREMRQKQYEDCVRHHSGKACIPPK
jgi:hypothetical protein